MDAVGIGAAREGAQKHHLSSRQCLWYRSECFLYSFSLHDNDNVGKSMGAHNANVGANAYARLRAMPQNHLRMD